MQNIHKAPYPVIDTDPNMGRVIRYFRATDYAVIAAVAAVGPAFMHFMEKYQPTGNSAKSLARSVKIAGGLGVFAGFLTAYARCSARFWGFSENAREIQKYRAEYKKLKEQGKPMHGHSNMPLNIQRTAAEYSTGAFLNFDVIPWFNLASHPYHGQSEGVIPPEEK